MTIDKYLSLSVKDCKRLGFLRPDATVSGCVEWKRDGAVIASVGFATKTTGVPVARFSYEANGEPMAYDVALRWKRSNLNAATEHGYYYFVCPVTGALCRKLYLVDGRFVGRKAFHALYEQQTFSQKERRERGPWRDLLAVDDLVYNQRYRRETYAGRLTPYGRKVEKYCRRLHLYERAAAHDAAN